MFKTLKKDDTEVEISIIGARAQNSNFAAASINFGNYDHDTQLTYRLGEISLVDHFGDSEHNGYGDMVFKTNTTGAITTELPSHMIINYQGNVGIGTSMPSERLHVNGNIKAATIYADTIYTQTMCNNVVVTTSNELTAFTNLSTVNLAVASNLTAASIVTPNISLTSNAANAITFYGDNGQEVGSIMSSNGQIVLSNVHTNDHLNIPVTKPYVDANVWTLVSSWRHSYDVHKHLDFVGVTSLCINSSTSSNESYYKFRLVERESANILAITQTLSNQTPEYIYIPMQPKLINDNTHLELHAKLEASNVAQNMHSLGYVKILDICTNTTTSARS